MISEHHLPVSRTARYYQLGSVTGETRDLWIVCHGYAQLARNFVRRFSPLEAPHRAVAAPEGLSRFYVGDHTLPATPETVIGASWMTREDRDTEIADYVAYLDNLADRLAGAAHPDLRLTLLGFSQGTATVSRWLVRGRVRAHRMVLWGGPAAHDLDHETSRSRLAGLDVVLVAGEEDRYITPKVRTTTEEHLRRLGAPVRTVLYQGGHEIHEATLRTLAGA